MSKIREQYRPAQVLASWRDVNEALPYMTEDELLAAIKAEARKPLEEKRTDVIHRLHRRYSKLRQERELGEYLS